VGTGAEEREGWNTKAKRWADQTKYDPDAKIYRDYFLPLPNSFSIFKNSVVIPVNSGLISGYIPDLAGIVQSERGME
jgi:hypothetical protein